MTKKQFNPKKQQGNKQEKSIEQQEIEQKAQLEQAKMQQEDALNQRDNETKILIAQINASSEGEEDGVIEPEFSEEARANLLEKMRQFDERLKLDREKLEFDKDKHREDNQLKDKISLRQTKNRSNSSNSTK